MPEPSYDAFHEAPTIPDLPKSLAIAAVNAAREDWVLGCAVVGAHFEETMVIPRRRLSHVERTRTRTERRLRRFLPVIGAALAAVALGFIFAARVWS